MQPARNKERLNRLTTRQRIETPVHPLPALAMCPSPFGPSFSASSFLLSRSR